MEKKWYRVIDPINPLFGCDVAGLVDDDNLPGYLQVTAMRRVDIFVGDRPFQLVAPDGESLGVLVDTDHLADSLIQDETVELATDRPFGRCIDESELERRDGVTLRIARYENAVQIAIEDADDCIVANRTMTDSERKFENHLVNLWTDGGDIDDLVTALKLAGGN